MDVFGRVLKPGCVWHRPRLALAWSAAPARRPPGRCHRHRPSGTPQLANTGATEQVRQLAQCGGTMYAVGHVHLHPAVLHHLRPEQRVQLQGDLAVQGDDLGSERQRHRQLDRLQRHQLHRWRTWAGSSPGERHRGQEHRRGRHLYRRGRTRRSRTAQRARSRRCSTYGSHLLTGGYFTSINGSSADPYFTSLSPTTGKDDGYLNLNISGNYQFPGCASQPDPGLQPAAQQRRHARPGGGRLHLGRRPAPAADLHAEPGRHAADGHRAGPPEFSAGLRLTGRAVLRQAAAWSPDDSTIYIATTGYHPYEHADRRDPADRAVRRGGGLPRHPGVVSHLWINYTGCDSLYSAAADASTAYFAGHERWAENPDGCDAQARARSPRPAWRACRPATGRVTFNPTRARGLGADDMLLTSAGLWIASDNFDGSAGVRGLRLRRHLLPPLQRLAEAVMQVGESRVLYVGGLSRSGSTLIERLIGELPGVCAVGELVHLWERGIAEGERCGCGEPFRRVPVLAAGRHDGLRRLGSGRTAPHRCPPLPGGPEPVHPRAGPT